MSTSVTASGLTVDWTQIVINKDGSGNIQLQYFNATNTQIAPRNVTIPANSANALVDQYGNVIASGGGWNTFAGQISTFVTGVNTTVSGAATGNKLNL